MISRKLATVFSVPNSIDNTLPGSWIDHNPWPLSVNYEQKIHKNIKIPIRVELEQLLYKSLCEKGYQLYLLQLAPKVISHSLKVFFTRINA